MKPTIYKMNEIILIVSLTTINCNTSLSNQKSWTIYKVNEQTGKDEALIELINNPTINYAELVLKPQSLLYGVYRIIYAVTLTSSNLTKLTSSVDTYLQVIPSGLVISSLRASQPMYGGTIEITRGINQKIEFDPFLNTFDIDSVAVITSLKFKYSCQLIDSNIELGFPQMPGTVQILHLDEIKANSSLISLEACFNSTSNKSF